MRIADPRLKPGPGAGGELPSGKGFRSRRPAPIRSQPGIRFSMSIASVLPSYGISRGLLSSLAIVIVLACGEYRIYGRTGPVFLSVIGMFEVPFSERDAR